MNTLPPRWDLSPERPLCREPRRHSFGVGVERAKVGVDQIFRDESQPALAVSAWPHANHETPFRWSSIAHVFGVTDEAQIGPAIVESVAIHVIDDIPLACAQNQPMKEKRLPGRSVRYLGLSHRVDKTALDGHGVPSILGQMGVFIVDDGAVSAREVDFDHVEMIIDRLPIAQEGVCHL